MAARFKAAVDPQPGTRLGHFSRVEKLAADRGWEILATDRGWEKLAADNGWGTLADDHRRA